MDDLETRLHDELHSVALGVQPSGVLDEQVPARIRQRTRRRSALLAGVGIAAVLGLVVGLVVLTNDDEPTAVDTVDDAEGAAPRPGEWAMTAPAPIEPRVAFASAWTGEELLVWGGAGRKIHGDGAAYNPATDEWRTLPEAPIEARTDPVSAWTGDEWWVFGGQTGDEEYAPGAAAYDPAANSWRTLDQLSESLSMWGATGSATTVIWADGELVLANLIPGPLTDSFTNSFVVEADGDWRGLAYVGAEAAVYPDDGTGTLLMTGPGSGSDPPCASTCLWRVPLAGGIEGEEVEVLAEVSGPTGPLVWADGVVVDSNSVIDPATGAVTGLTDGSLWDQVWADTSLVAAELPPVSELVNSTDGSLGPTWFQYDPVARIRVEAPAPPEPAPRFAATAVWTGEEVLVWGGHNCAPDMTPGGECSFEGPTTGLRYRPDAIATSPTTGPGTTATSDGSAPPTAAPATTFPVTTVPPTTATALPTTTVPGATPGPLKLEAAGWWWGTCLECDFTVTLDGSEVRIRIESVGSADVIENNGRLTAEGLEAIDDALAGVDIATLGPSYECAPCTSSGGFVRITNGPTTVEFRYLLGSAPEQLRDLDVVAEAIIHALAECRTTELVVVEKTHIDVAGDLAHECS